MYKLVRREWKLVRKARKPTGEWKQVGECEIGVKSVTAGVGSVTAAVESVTAGVESVTAGVESVTAGVESVTASVVCVWQLVWRVWKLVGERESWFDCVGEEKSWNGTKPRLENNLPHRRLFIKI